MIDAIYCISLERMKDRRTHMVEFLSKIDFCPVYFFDAVDGLDYDWSDFYKEGIYEYKNWKVAKEHCKVYFSDDVFVDVTGCWDRDITKGEMGCAVSHYSAWKHAYENGYENVLMFEDDVERDENILINCVNIFLKFTENNLYDLFYFGCSNVPLVDVGLVSDDVMQVNFAWCLQSYVIHIKAIEILLNANFLKSITPLDEFIPASFGFHPRKDINELYDFRRKLIAYRIARGLLGQTNLGGSQTEL